MNTQFLVIYGVFLASVLLSKSMKKKADMTLSDNKREQLADLMSQGRGFTIYVLLGLVGLFVANLFFNVVESFVAITMFFGLTMSFMVYNAVMTYNKIKENDFPKTYITSYIYWNIIQFVGFVTLYLGVFNSSITFE